MNPAVHGAPRGTGRSSVRLLLAVLLLAVPAPGGLAGQEPRTAAEASGFDRHTTHPEMMDYLEALRASSLDMRLSSYGETREGRELPYAVFSRPLVSQPWEAALLGRPIVLLAANVHGGERTFREGLLVLMRDLATRGTPENALLDELVVVVAPQINPDGFHTGERGQRGNAWGIDLNRDYIKLEHPEIVGYIDNLVNEWHPHIFVDGHNGGAFPYNLNYQCASHASADPALTEICDFEIFPAIDAALAAEGMKAFYYTGGTETRWNTGGFEARIGRNYGGFTNAIGMLFEAPGGQTLETGARAGWIGYKTVLEYARDHAAQVIETVDRARLETLRQGQAAEGDVVVRMRYGPEDRTVRYELARGQGDEREIIQVTSDSLMKKPVPLVTRPRPYAYLLPREALDAVAMLQRHDVTVEQLLEDTELAVQGYTIGALGYTQQYDHAAAVEVDVAEVVTRTVSFPRGTYVVPTGQVLGRLVSHMLEPETEDNVIYWNTMDAWLPRPGQGPASVSSAPGDDRPEEQEGAPLVPIYKLMEPTPLPTRMLPVAEAGR